MVEDNVSRVSPGMATPDAVPTTIETPTTVSVNVRPNIPSRLSSSTCTTAIQDDTAVLRNTNTNLAIMSMSSSVSSMPSNEPRYNDHHHEMTHSPKITVTTTDNSTSPVLVVPPPSTSTHYQQRKLVQLDGNKATTAVASSNNKKDADGQLEEMKQTIHKLETSMLEQNLQLHSMMKQQCDQMTTLMKTVQSQGSIAGGATVDDLSTILTRSGFQLQLLPAPPPTIPEEDPLPFHCGSYQVTVDQPRYQHNNNNVAPSSPSTMTWQVDGYSGIVPDPDYKDYFVGLDWNRKKHERSLSMLSSSTASSSSSSSDQSNRRPSIATAGANKSYNKNKVISVIIPCYNEEGSDLDRTIRGLSRQIMPKGWRVEVVIVMDGITHMSDSMARYLYQMFGVEWKHAGGSDGTNGDSGAGKDDEETPNGGQGAVDYLSLGEDGLNDKSYPFKRFPDAQTVIVHPIIKNDHDKAAAENSTRLPAMDGTIGGFSLVVKRKNRRKANSQMWWLGPHASTVNAKYVLATDCGTYFERTTTLKLLNRMESEIHTMAVTGFQRTMPSVLQGDGSFEMCTSPFDFVLRNLQRFEFDVDHVSFMGVYDTLGAMHVIPGPCGLFRYSQLGNLKEGLMHDYFKLFSRSNRGLILGNVELVEDRIPGTLLAFPPKSSSKVPAKRPPEGWPRTGFVHDAIFYMEAEKPLSQLVKQRRRWLNGTFATYLWMLKEGIITNSNQDPFTKFMSWIMVAWSVMQGMVTRLFGPALNIVWMFRFGLFIPDLVTDPSQIFDPNVNLLDVESLPDRLGYGLLLGGVYLILYVAFVVGHTPRAKPIQDEISIVRYTEPSRYTNDSNSAYRWWLFLPVLLINVLVIALYVVNAVGIITTLGWTGTPLSVRILILFCMLPFLMALLDGVVRCNFRPLCSMMLSAPVCLPLLIWFTIWLPAYATTRLSDLTWGNRERESLDDESETALLRAANGKRVAYFLIGFNTTVACAVILAMQLNGMAFPIFVLSYTLVLSAGYVVSLLDVVVRFFSCVGNDMPTEDSDVEEEEHHSYKKMGENTEKNGIAEGRSNEGWCSWLCCWPCLGSSRQTKKCEDAKVPLTPNEEASTLDSKPSGLK